MQRNEKSKPSMKKNERRRGRPAGKNRLPLSLEERRARNAQYERERRNETAEAMAQLAEAAGCDPQITNPDLLATVISRLQAASREPSESIEDLKRINNNLESQIAMLQTRLENDPNFKEDDLDDTTLDRPTHLQSNSDADNNTEHIPHRKYRKIIKDRPTSSQTESDLKSESSTKYRPAKYRKVAKESRVHNRAFPIRQNSRESSSDSQDSILSHHHLGKTLPGQETSQPCNNVPLDSFKSPIQNITTELSEMRPTSSSENEYYTETSYQLDASEPTMSQQEVKMEIQLVAQEDQVNTRPRVEDQSEINFMDPFTEREKGILERLGYQDYITFEDNDVRDETTLRWPLDFDDLLTGF